MPKFEARFAGNVFSLRLALFLPLKQVLRRFQYRFLRVCGQLAENRSHCSSTAKFVHISFMFSLWGRFFQARSWTKRFA